MALCALLQNEYFKILRFIIRVKKKNSVNLIVSKKYFYFLEINGFKNDNSDVKVSA